MKLKKFEWALLVGVVFAALAGIWAEDQSGRLKENLLRMHVVANSDAERDQSLKLEVRDAVLAAADGMLASAKTLADARNLLDLQALQASAAAEIAARGYDYPVSVAIRDERFPTREYDGFSLPAGEYTALRVTIGEGAGKNWWCVVFPPLCEAAASGSDLEGLDGDSVKLIADTGEVRIGFKIVELFGGLRGR